LLAPEDRTLQTQPVAQPPSSPDRVEPCRNIALEIRSADGKYDRLVDQAADLVRSRVDLIVADTGTAAVAAKKATQTIAIVMLASGDAVRQGLAASLARLVETSPGLP
jgi:putative ABC transport system substrate-binding protein